MRKVFLDDLPRWEKGEKAKEGTINWEESIGYDVDFIYDDVKGKIKIIDYNKTTRNLFIRYLDSPIIKILVVNFIKCKIGKCFNLGCFKFKFNIGQTISTKLGKIKILKQVRVIRNQNNIEYKIKAYKYKCLICGNIDEISEVCLNKGQGCNVCTNQKIIKGINDLNTTDSSIGKTLKNFEEGYLISRGSHKKLTFVCPSCGYEKKYAVHNIVFYKFSCPKCGDGISYPEKFMFNMLEQLNIKFNIHNIFEWSKNIQCDNNLLCGDKEYDFHFKIDNEKYIIETHGLQHYKEGKRGRSLKEEQENDKLKKELAIQNGIKEENYIVIDCRESDLDFIKNNILHSRLNETFDLSQIDWLKCERFALSSRVKEACDLWNSGIHNTIKIGNKMKLCNNTIVEYLKQGAKLNWCNYKTPHQKKKEKIYEVCKLWNDGMNVKAIHNNTQLSATMIIDYLKYCNKNKLCVYNAKEEQRKGIKNSIIMNKKIICLTTNTVFNSISAAHEIYNINITSLSQVCRKVRKSAGKHPITGEPLKWMYYDDYIKLKNNINIVHNENNISV